jgi:hypothetical protein
MAECIGLVFEDETEAEELAQLMREKLSKLPEKYMQVLELIFYQDYREREAAEKLGIPVDRLYSIKSDALKRLRKLCAKDSRLKPLLTQQAKPITQQTKSKRATSLNNRLISKRNEGTRPRVDQDLTAKARRHSRPSTTNPNSAQDSIGKSTA